MDAVYIRNGITSLVYNKVLKLRHDVINNDEEREDKQGNIINVIQKNAQDIENSSWKVPYLIIGPFNALAISFILYYFVSLPPYLKLFEQQQQQVGKFWWVVVLGLFLLTLPKLLLLKFQANIKTKFSKFQIFYTLADQRVGLISQIIDGIKTIKAYAYQEFYSEKIKQVRQKEYKYYIYNAMLDSSQQSLQRTAGLFLAGLLFVLSIHYSEQRVTPSGILASLAAILYVSNYSFLFIFQALSSIAQLVVLCRRISKILSYQQKKEERGSIRYKKNVIALQNVNTKWKYKPPSQSNNNHSPEQRAKDFSHINQIFPNNLSQPLIGKELDYREYSDILLNLSLEYHAGELVVITGSVGSGKSTMLSAILGETFLCYGTITRPERVFYCSTQPLIINDTLAQNIYFGNNYQQSEEKYIEIDDDINENNLQNDDQKYKNKQRLWQILRLVSMDQQVRRESFPKQENTQVGEKGKTLSGGQMSRVSLARALFAEGADLYLLDDIFASLDAKVMRQILERAIKQQLLQRRNKIVMLVTQNEEIIRAADHIVILDNGQIKSQGKFEQLQDSNDLFFANFQMRDKDKKIEDIIREKSPNLSLERINSHEAKNDQFEDDQYIIGQQLQLRPLASKLGSSQQDIIVTEERFRGRVPFKIFKRYFSYSCGCFGVLLCLILSLIASLNKIGASLWLEHWSSQDTLQQQQNYKNAYFYGAIIGSLFIFMTFSYFFTSCLILLQSRNIHKSMIQKVIGAKINFFESNSSGVILNRFGPQMGVLDTRLVEDYKPLFNNLITCLTVFGTMIVSNPLLLIFACLFFFYLLWVRNKVLKTSRQASRLCSISKSPVTSQLQSTCNLNGLVTIRAYDKQDYFHKRYQRLVDQNTRAVLTLCAANRWSGSRIDLVQYVFMLILLISGGFLKSLLNRALIAVSLQLGIQLAQGFPLAIRMTQQIQNRMTSVQRVLHFTDIPQEQFEEESKSRFQNFNPLRTQDLKFKNVSLRYKRILPYALKDINFSVEKGEKLGIIGRTGSGKSTIFNAILGFIDTFSQQGEKKSQSYGNIFLGGQLCTKLMDLRTLRQKFIYVPQHPFLFSGASLRDNLDPYRVHQFQDIIKVLKSLGLINFMKAHQEWVLNQNQPIRPYSISDGERQLLSFARALLKNGEIILLDEASAYQDAQKEKLMSQAMRQYFGSKTQLIIAHRLRTIQNLDKIMALKNGQIIQYGPPSELEKDQTSYFYQCLSKDD